ncbi:MAG: monovalent cation/H(+) antiporter subunit G [Gammaproteobacteria bacterium]|nr:monovalent cation/H(+) antiporter subunit G [Gammaproteobacteria bacterium]
MIPVADVVSWVCLLAGGAFAIIGALGLVRMPSLFTRIHAASVIDTLGAGLILLGLVVQAGFTLIAVKLAVLALLIVFTTPVATHALAKAAMARGVDPLQTQGDPSKR